MISYKSGSNILLILIILVFPLFSGENLSSFEWMLGKWRYENDSIIMDESWERLSSNTIEGINQTYSKSEDRIVQEESLRLVAMSGKIFYIVKVAHNKLPIAFKLTSYSDSTAIFENADHDFPKRIEYLWIDKDRLIVEVSNDEKKFKIDFSKM